MKESISGNNHNGHGINNGDSCSIETYIARFTPSVNSAAISVDHNGSELILRMLDGTQIIDIASISPLSRDERKLLKQKLEAGQIKGVKLGQTWLADINIAEKSEG
jgi:hypothetical protein